MPPVQHGVKSDRSLDAEVAIVSGCWEGIRPLCQILWWMVLVPQSVCVSVETHLCICTPRSLSWASAVSAVSAHILPASSAACRNGIEFVACAAVLIIIARVFCILLKIAKDCLPFLCAADGDGVQCLLYPLIFRLQRLRLGHGA